MNKVKNSGAQRSAEKTLSLVKLLLRLPLPPAAILMTIVELLEHGPNMVNKLIR